MCLPNVIRIFLADIHMCVADNSHMCPTDIIHMCLPDTHMCLPDTHMCLPDNIRIFLADIHMCLADITHITSVSNRYHSYEYCQLDTYGFREPVIRCRPTSYVSSRQYSYSIVC